MEIKSAWPQRTGGLIVAVLSAAWFGWGLDSEPFFADESAYIAYSHYFRLIARPNDENWLHFAAFDSPPLYKYMIGGSIHLAGRKTPDSLADAERWHAGRHDPPADPVVLRAARISMLAGAVLGCVAIYLCGCVLVGMKTGLLAALCLALSPLYYTHSRRAMADDWTQAFVLLSLWSAERLWSACSRRPVGVGSSLRWMLCLTLFAGLGLATKLSAATACLTIGAVVGASAVALAVVRTGRALSTGRILWTLAATVLSLVAALGLSIAVNPYFYAQPSLPPAEASGNDRIAAKRREMAKIRELDPIGRLRYMLNYRKAAQSESMSAFPDYALATPWKRAAAIFFEGLGRWTFLGRLPELGRSVRTEPADSVRLRGDNLPPISFHTLRASVAFAMCLAGLAFLWSEGRRQLRAGNLPRAWFFVAWPIVEFAVLLANLTLDWDRYYMGIVCCVSLLIPVGLAGIVVRIAEKMILAPPGAEDDA